MFLFINCGGFFLMVSGPTFWLALSIYLVCRFIFICCARSTHNVLYQTSLVVHNLEKVLGANYNNIPGMIPHSGFFLMRTRLRLHEHVIYDSFAGINLDKGLNFFHRNPSKNFKKPTRKNSGINFMKE